MKKIALFFGGPSNEHEVSIMSAKNVVKYFDYKKYRLILIYWSRKNHRFYLIKNINKLSISQSNRLKIEDFSKLFDIALPMTHGRYGEDGVLQAILESQKIKYCGCRVLSSAVCMDKAVFKNLLTAQNIPQVKYHIIDFQNDRQISLASIEKIIKRNFSFPVYIKPANSGSSVGITRVEKMCQLATAVREAQRHDPKILIEQGLTNPREIEMAVLGNKQLLISRPGELRLVKDFYNYDDKYKLGQAQLVIPTKLTSIQSKQIIKIVEQVYRLTNCQGFARIDFFISKNNKIYLNEINTLPGFTDISMYPKLMMNQGMTYQQLINRIIKLAY